MLGDELADVDAARPGEHPEVALGDRHLAALVRDELPAAEARAAATSDSDSPFRRRTARSCLPTCFGFGAGDGRRLGHDLGYRPLSGLPVGSAGADRRGSAWPQALRDRFAAHGRLCARGPALASIPTAYVHPDATVIGNVTIGAGIDGLAADRAAGRLRVHRRSARARRSRTAPSCTPRRSYPTIIGDDCVIGHLAHLECCTVHDGALVGTGSIVLHRAVVESGALGGRGRGGSQRHGRARPARWRSACPRSSDPTRSTPTRSLRIARLYVGERRALPRRAPPHRLTATSA